MDFLRKWRWHAAYSVFYFAITTFLLFTTFELYPALLNVVNLQTIRYYALKTNYIPDSTLVIAPRRTNYRFATESKGDLYRHEYGVSVPDIRYQSSYTEMGFRANSSSPPYQVLVLGDSFVELGDDSSTLSERLRKESSFTTFNLGRAWYGPHQYLELFKRYGVTLKPKYAVFCFFSGNDIHDIKEYERWRRQGTYYFYTGELSRGFFTRYLIALSDTGSYVLKRIAGLRRNSHARSGKMTTAQESRIHPGLAVIRIGKTDTKMKVTGWDDEGTAEQLLTRREWQTLRYILAAYLRLCRDNGIRPILLYIPSKIEVYADYATAESGQTFKSQLRRFYPYRSNASEAIAIIAKGLGLPFANLLPYFKRLTEQGELLYYPFDSHWNTEGINAGARFLAAYLKSPPSLLP